MMRSHLPAFLGLLLLTGVPGHAQTGEPGSASEPESRPGVYVGMASCGANNQCHGSPEPLAETAVLQNEYFTWLGSDPHRKAWEVLTTAESRAIAELLEPGKKATEIPLCLECHAIDAPASKRDGLYVEDGISCEGCHGPAGGWSYRHYETGWERSQSIAAGLRDLRDLEVRSKVCLGCHLGVGETSVDHRLIAAGHPRLHFELDNYTGSLPRHWRLDREREDRPPSHGVHAWAVGQAMSFKTGLEILAQKARGSGPWPEFAEYECRGCHHALASGWREEPGYRFHGGLPRWSPARWVVLRQLVAELAPGELERLDNEVAELAAEVSRMGDRETVATRAEEIANSLDPVIRELDRARWSPKRARGLLVAIAADRETLLGGGVASAEQAAWAVQSLLYHLVGERPRLASGELAAAVDELYAELRDPNELDRARFAAALERLEEAAR